MASTDIDALPYYDKQVENPGEPQFHTDDSVMTSKVSFRADLMYRCSQCRSSVDRRRATLNAKSVC